MSSSEQYASRRGGGAIGPNIGAVQVVEEADGVLVLELVGEMDISNAPEILSEATRALDRGHHLIVDLSATAFIDSTALGALVRTSALAAERERTFRLQFGSAEIVERALAITGITKHIPCVPTRAEALQQIHVQAATR